jgi:glutathione reductase (NADPH)
MQGYGIEASHKPIAWKTFVENRSAYIARLNGIYQKNLEGSNITIVRGRGEFVGERQVRVNDETFTAEHVLVATGGRPLVPSVPGAELGITSDGFFDLQELPKRVLIVGAGYIAVELAGIFAVLGSATSIAIRFLV